MKAPSDSRIGAPGEVVAESAGPARTSAGARTDGEPGGATRVLALWSPDWPVTAAAMAAHVPPHRPAAVIVANRVLACSAVARAQGVRRGLRRREAQARCPDLAVLDRDPDRDAVRSNRSSPPSRSWRPGWRWSGPAWWRWPLRGR
ncbi:hypothetical protein BJF90_31740 [Pseudonocardia sp. CNS-004]|nr:hypothetical protein BJF90_31740 [Pseudonocardia sp. CNS-004]